MVLALRRRGGLSHPRGRGQVLLQIMLLPKISPGFAPKPMDLFREAVSHAVMVSELYVGQHGR